MKYIVLIVLLALISAASSVACQPLPPEKRLQIKSYSALSEFLGSKFVLPTNFKAMSTNENFDLAQFIGFIAGKEMTQQELEDCIEKTPGSILPGRRQYLIELIQACPEPSDSHESGTPHDYDEGFDPAFGYNPCGKYEVASLIARQK